MDPGGLPNISGSNCQGAFPEGFFQLVEAARSRTMGITPDAFRFVNQDEEVPFHHPLMSADDLAA